MLLPRDGMLGASVGVLLSKQDARRFCEETLWASLTQEDREESVTSATNTALDSLSKQGAITFSEDAISPTKLGVATFSSSLPSLAGVSALSTQLQAANNDLVLEGGLMVAFLLTPPNHNVDTKWETLAWLYEALPAPLKVTQSDVAASDCSREY